MKRLLIILAAAALMLIVSFFIIPLTDHSEDNVYLRVMAKEGTFYFRCVDMKSLRKNNYILTGITNLVFTGKE